MLRLALLAITLCPLFAADWTLPKPDTTGGKPLHQALAERKSTRQFAPRALPDQVLSNLLWAAYGVNRPATGGRTAPSAMNTQAIELYVLLERGVFRYDARAHTLRQLAATDARSMAGSQSFVSQAPVNLILVAPGGKLKSISEPDRLYWLGVEAGAVTQNVSLFCASQGLGTVVRGSGVQKAEFLKLAGLPADTAIVIAQTVGFPQSQ